VSLILALALAAAPPEPAGFQRAMLEEHNRPRAEVGAPPLAWDPALAADAEAYARKLAASGRFEHSGAKGQGENLWRGTRGAYRYHQMVGGWSGEAGDYRHDVFPRVSRTGRWQDVGHYTQLVWRDTSRVGCALATGRDWDVLVCRYSPPGNWVGKVAY
jgi:Cysteine-rich secretory protein family